MSRRARLQKSVPMIQTGLATLVAGSVSVNTALVPSLKLLRGCVIWARHTAIVANIGTLAIVEASTTYSAPNATTGIIGGNVTFIVTSTNAMDVGVVRWIVFTPWGVDVPNTISS